jgi:mRNA-degrading endonuclease RelE of RelBE toxin-antitoxin system
VRYQIDYTEEARRAIPDLPGNYRQRIKREIIALADNPRPAKAERLRDGLASANSPERYKIQLDRWRIIYRVIEDEQIVRIIRIRLKHGPETYEGLED